eukprot:1038389-Ditylum_brightwellii.AAC.1
MRRGAYLLSLADDVAVVNNHLIREAEWKVDCMAKQHGGAQSIWFSNGDNVPLEYDATKYKLYVKCHCPTPKEISTIPVHCIDYHIDDLAVNSGMKLVRKEKHQDTSGVLNLADLVESPEFECADIVETRTVESNEKATVADIQAVPEETLEALNDNVVANKGKMDQNKTNAIVNMNDFDWKETLGHCTERIISKMLDNTTQYSSTCLEAENRAYPVQHHAKKLHPLHFWHLCGRDCADTFFSPMKSAH